MSDKRQGGVRAAAPKHHSVVDGLSRLKRNLPDDVHQRIKLVACHLFALRGIDGVATRDILQAAKVKNAGAIGYYFGSKENLVRQILVEGTRQIDQRRGELLDACLREDEPLSIEVLVNILIHAITDQADIGERRFICFTLMASLSHRDLYVTTMFREPSIHFSRCIAHLKQLMPPMPPSAQHQRLLFMKSNMGMALARRESALASGDDANEWASDNMLRHYICSETAMLGAAFDESIWPDGGPRQIRDVNAVTHDPL
ncbi:transcriptional regulator, TetR family [Sphingobium faniae]|nr:transcriptional regulator, TetR family [Sphingobium faniae]